MSAPFTALGYYKVSPDLVGHPKILTFASELGINEWEALGKWHAVLSFASKYVPETGNLSRYSAAMVSRAAGWEGDPEVFMNAMIVAELADKDTHKDTQKDTQVGTQIWIHGWLDWHGDVVESREVHNAKIQGGKLGAHRKHHKGSENMSPNCDYCLGVLEEPIKESLVDRVEDRKSKGEQSTGGDSDL